MPPYVMTETSSFGLLIVYRSMAVPSGILPKSALVTFVCAFMVRAVNAMAKSREVLRSEVFIGSHNNANAQPYLNFSVVSANSANTSAAIQNRTITFDSDHPSNSK